MYFTLKIDCDNAAFADEPGAEVAELLRTAATRVEAGRTDAPIIDTNGATVGAWAFITEPDTEPDEAIPYDLRLSFTPDAIREHFQDDEPDPTEDMTDEQLAEVGRTALTDDGLYRAFHDALVWALPDDEPDGTPDEQWQVTEPPEVYATDDDDDPNDLLGGAKR